MEENFEATQGIGTSEQTTEQGGGQEAQQANNELLDLSTLEKFKYGDKEWTPKDLDAAIMRNADYTRKTQEIAKERKYYDNLQADLNHVKNDPSLAAEFMKHYPSKFHKYLDYVVSKPQASNVQAQTQSNPYDQRLNKLESTLTAWQTEQHEKQVASYEAEIDAHLSKAHSNYKDVLVNDKAKDLYDAMVIQRAQLLKDSGQVDKFTSGVWGKITESVASDFRSLIGEKQSALFNKQKSANVRGKDTPVGGAIPGQAPVRPKTLKEATAAAIAHYENNRG